MKRSGLIALMTGLLLLAGCTAGDTAENDFGSWQETLRTAQRVDFEAAVTADFGDKTFAYRAALHYADGEAQLCLTEPAILAGVTLQSADGGVTLAYDGAALELGDLTGNGLSPAAALPAVLDALQNGRLLSLARTREEGAEYLMLSLAARAGELTVWLERESLTPVRAELAEAGRVALVCDISQWHLEGAAA